MAAGALPAPGTALGPCPDPPGCQHRDCAANRAMAAEACRVCGEPIGYERLFFRSPGPTPGWWSYAHAGCAYEADDAARPAGGHPPGAPR